MASRKDRITQQRLEKLERVRASGIDPYPRRYHRSHTTQQAVALLEQKEADSSAAELTVNVAGRVMAIRHMGKSAFADLRDDMLSQSAAVLPAKGHRRRVAVIGHQV